MTEDDMQNQAINISITYMYSSYVLLSPPSRSINTIPVDHFHHINNKRSLSWLPSKRS